MLYREQRFNRTCQRLCGRRLSLILYRNEPADCTHRRKLPRLQSHFRISHRLSWLVSYLSSCKASVSCDNRAHGLYRLERSQALHVGNLGYILAVLAFAFRPIVVLPARRDGSLCHFQQCPSSSTSRASPPTGQFCTAKRDGVFLAPLAKLTLYISGIKYWYPRPLWYRCQHAASLCTLRGRQRNKNGATVGN